MNCNLRYLVYACFVIIIMVSCYKDNQQNLTLQSTFCGESIDSSQIFYINCKLTNSGSDTIHFLTLAACYEDFFTINNENFEFVSDNCYSNMAIVLSIPPDKSTDFYLKLKPKKNNTDKYKESIKIGIYSIKILSPMFKDVDEKYRLIEGFKINKIEYKPIWSEAINLSRLEHEIY